MKEGIAGTIGEFDEAESLLSTEPFDDPTDRWAGRGLEPRLCESGSGAKSTRLWAVRYRRRSLDAASYGNLDVSLWFLEGVVDQFERERTMGCHLA